VGQAAAGIRTGGCLQQLAGEDDVALVQVAHRPAGPLALGTRPRPGRRPLVAIPVGPPPDIDDPPWAFGWGVKVRRGQQIQHRGQQLSNVETG
jgi:hypothetical protein